MPKNKINTRRLNEYKNVFGAEKMRFLWQEYLAQSAQNWQNMDNTDWEARRQIFHNWRSSSKVFGMDGFALICQQIEDKILKRRFDGLDKKIELCRQNYEQSTGDVGIIFLQMEP